MQRPVYSVFLSILLLLSIFTTTSYAQDYKSEFQKMCQEGRIDDALPLMTKWEKERPDDPEMFIAFFNFYFNQSRNEVVEMGKQPGSGDQLTITDPATKEPVGYMYGRKTYDDSLFQLAQNYIKRGIVRNPDRLDMHFGRLYSLREAGFIQEHIDGILNVIDVHAQKKPAWRWSDNQLLTHADAMFKGSIQDYIHALFNIEKEVPLAGIEKISRKMMTLYPEDVENYSNIGACRLIGQKYEEALEYFKKGSALNPNDAIVLSNIAYTYMQMGKNADAITFYRKVVDAGDEEIAEFAKEQIEILKKR